MDLFTDSDPSSAVLLMKYGPLPKRKRDINSACRSGKTIIATTTGVTPTEQRSASPISSGLRRLDNDDLLERLARLATSGPVPGAPPLDLYRTETGEHGEVYIATNEYREWFRRTHPGAVCLGDCPRPAPSGSTERPRSKKELTF